MEITNKIEFGWHLPTSGDGRYVGIENEREGTLHYLIEVAKAAEGAGFEFILIPTGGDCTDSWVVGSAIAAHTKTLKSLVAMRPGLIAPVLAARMGASLDYISNGRALINIVSGGNPADLKSTGDSLYNQHDERYKRTLEFVQIVKEVWKQATINKHKNDEKTLDVSFNGEYFQVEGVKCKPVPVQKPHPPIYFGGSSSVGKRVAAEIADVYIMWVEPRDMIKEQIEEMESNLEQSYKETGIRKHIKYGLRAQIVVRETKEEAWQAAWNIISKVDNEMLVKFEKQQNKLDSINQRRQTELWKKGENNDYIIGPNLWAGISRIRSGGSVVLVGTPEEISDRILEFIEIGISSFIFSGYPHLEEAIIAGELLFPILKKKIENAGLSEKAQVTF